MNLIKTLDALPIDRQEQLINSILRDKYNASLALTAKYLCGYSGINPRTHGDVIRALESPKKRKLIVMPRGTFKSSLGSVAFPIWLLNRNPDLRILLDSEIYTNSKNFLREIKTHLMSEKLTSIYGEYYNKACWNEGEILIQQRKVIKKEASITASGIGAEKTGQHYDIVICDDLNSPSNSGTKEGREKVIQHYKYLISILEPEGILCLIGTRYSDDDCLGYVIKNEIEYEREAT